MKVLCPKHDDTVPSCELYENGAYCFAGCGMIPWEELGVQGRTTCITPRVIDSIADKLCYISTLKKDYFRGFYLPFDEKGYYLVWPDKSYYKLRVFDPKAKNKYLGPRGHTPPLFWVRRSVKAALMICEGEFDAMSAALSLPELDVVSPGSAGNLSKDAYLTEFLRYRTIIIVTDSDPAGMRGGRGLTGKLLGKGASLVRLFKSKDHDYNSTLVTSGKDSLRKQILW